MKQYACFSRNIKNRHIDSSMHNPHLYILTLSTSRHRIIESPVLEKTSKII